MNDLPSFPFPPSDEVDQQRTRLATADLSPAIPDRLRIRIVNIIVHATMSAPVGTKIDRHKLESLIQSTFETLWDGERFDYGPLRGVMLRVRGVTDEDIYVGLLNAMTMLKHLNIPMQAPVSSLDTTTKQRLLTEAYDRAKQEREEEERRSSIKRTAGSRLRLGDLLMKEQIIGEAELEEALQAQRRFGGRLGTNLVRLGLLTGESLAQFLSLQHAVPCCLSEREVNAVPAEVIALVPSEVAVEHRVVPISLEGPRLRLLMADPSDVHGIDTVAFQSSHSVQPVVGPEVLVAYALEKHFSVKRASQLLYDRVLEGERKLQVDQASAGMDRALPGDVGPSPTLGAPACNPGTVSLLSSQPNVKKSFERMVRALADAEEETEVLSALFDLVKDAFVRAAIFRIEGTEARGWLRSGEAVELKSFRSFRIAANGSENLVAQSVESRRMVRGRAGGSGEDAAVATALKLAAGREVCCAPLATHGKPTACIFVQEPTTPGAHQLLERAATLANAALSMVALRNYILNGFA